MALESLNTVMFVTDHRVVRRFFEEVLRFEVVRSWESDESVGTILRASPSSEVEIIGPPPGRTLDRRTRDLQISLNVTDAAELVDRIEEHGVFQVVDPLEERGWGVRSAGIRITDDLMVYVVERRA